ncbi:MAG: dTDP-4-dehydrorhamnose reductase [Gammaproteobacteria bacterium]|nr:dTDP-4-dehydrorhamnose reductase [Gammaproteobacteria bacterium]
MKVLVIGCTGQIGWELVRCLQPLGEVVAVNHRQMDLSRIDSIKATLKNFSPDVIINAAAYTAVDNAETNEVSANAINGYAPGILAAEAKQIGALLIHYSTDYVFDGKKMSPYMENDTFGPINVYGRSKLMGENAIQSVDMDYIILRISWIYSARRDNFLRTVLRLSQERDELRIVDDQVGAPTWARFVAESTVHVIKQSQAERFNDLFESNTYHLAAAGETSWYGFASALVEQARKMSSTSIKVKNITPITSDEYPMSAKRPKNSCLVTKKLENYFDLRMPPWDNILTLCVDEMFSDRKGL